MAISVAINNQSSEQSFDRVVIGGGIYGSYAAIWFAKKGYKTAIINSDDDVLERASLINQARVHNGYHYPRSLDTAMRSNKYYYRFCKDASFCINHNFKQIYQISATATKTNAKQFKDFCNKLNIICEEIETNSIFKKGTCEASFLTDETSFDANQLRAHMNHELEKNLVTIMNGCVVLSIKKNCQYDDDKMFKITTNTCVISAPFILNATYASINQIQKMAGFKSYDIKYELCEVILCDVSDNLKNMGITVMDGHFFSVMPFGKTGFHSITSVQFTPHETCYSELPIFECQKRSMGQCSELHLGNCNKCMAKPKTSWDKMIKLANQYLLDKFEIKYKSSIFAIKPILKTSENDDSRPTLIDVHSIQPTFVTVLSGKINTIYDLDDALEKISD